MRSLLSYIVITFLALNSCLLEAHDGSYEMTLDNYIEHNPDMTVVDIELVAECKVRDSYAEIFILNKEKDHCYFEFNNHFPNNGRWFANRAYDEDKCFSLTIFSYLNTAALKSKNHSYIWHGKPSLFRYNRGIKEIERGFFEDIVRDGYFEIFHELNYRHFGECWDRIENYTDITTSRKIFKYKVKLENPDEFKKFLKVPLTSHLPLEYRRKCRILLDKLNILN